MPLCPICGRTIGTYTNDPFLTNPSLSTDEYRGFTTLISTHIKELQDERHQQEIDNGVTPLTIFSPINDTGLFQNTKQYILELRESTEKILAVAGMTLSEFLSQDEDGNPMTTKSNWTDSNLEENKFQCKAIHIEDLRHYISVILWSEDFNEAIGHPLLFYTDSATSGSGIIPFQYLYADHYWRTNHVIGGSDIGETMGYFISFLSDAYLQWTIEQASSYLSFNTSISLNSAARGGIGLTGGLCPFGAIGFPLNLPLELTPTGKVILSDIVLPDAGTYISQTNNAFTQSMIEIYVRLHYSTYLGGGSYSTVLISNNIIFLSGIVPTDVYESVCRVYNNYAGTLQRSDRKQNSTIISWYPVLSGTYSLLTMYNAEYGTSYVAMPDNPIVGQQGIRAIDIIGIRIGALAQGWITSGTASCGGNFKVGKIIFRN
jgi:hypothetical protein